MRAKYFIILFFLTIFVSCNSDKGNILNDQIGAIEGYLNSKNMQYEVIGGIYKSMLDAPITPEEEPEVPEEPEIPEEPETPEVPEEPETPEVPETPEIPEVKASGSKVGEIVLQNGDKIYINYIAQLFKTAPNGVYATNIKAVAKQVGFDIINTEYAPQEIVYGETELIEGLRLGLQGSKKGDSFSLLIPYTFGYGEKANGIVPPSSALNIDIDVIDIVR